MKEYWVNVYDIGLVLTIKAKAKAKWPATSIYGKLYYRLHVREFDTREAKELYLKMKYGRVIKYYFDYAKLKPLLGYNNMYKFEDIAAARGWMNQ